MKRPNLEKIERLFEENEDSAIAKRAKKYGFKVIVIPQYVEFRKVGDN